MPARHAAYSRVLLVALALSAGTTAGLLLEAVRAGRSHRDVVRRVLGDYARAAGWLFAAGYRADVEDELLSALGPALVARASVHEIERWAAGAARCPGADVDQRRFYFTLEPAAQTARTSGATPTAAARAILLDTLPLWSRMSSGRWWLRSYGDPGPNRRLLVAAIRRDPDGTPVGLLGFDTCQRWLLAKLRGVLENHRLLPPFLVGEAPPTSLLSVVATRVRTRDTVFRTPIGYPAEYSAVTRSVGLEGLDFEVAINPAAAPRLILDGLPRSRLPWLLALLTLTCAAFAVLLLQLRQGLRLARAQTDVVTGVSHEIRTPLAQILLFGESLKYGTARSQAERKFASDVIVEEASRLIHLAENVLHVSRPGRKIRPSQIEPLRLAPLVRQAVSAFEPLARTDRNEFALELDESVVAAVDPRALRQILINLLDNAVKFGADRQRITISVASTPTRALIAVADRGPGVPLADRNLVWEPFTRLGADPGRKPGSGIGLTVVRDLVRGMGGEVWIEDRPGGGARFVVGLVSPGTGR